MDQIVRFEGQALQDLMYRLRDLCDPSMPDIRSLEFAVDGGLKIKVDSSSWSPPLGAATIDGHPVAPR